MPGVGALAPAHIQARAEHGQNAQGEQNGHLQRQGGEPAHAAEHPEGEHRIPQVVFDRMLGAVRASASTGRRANDRGRSTVTPNRQLRYGSPASISTIAGVSASAVRV